MKRLHSRLLVLLAHLVLACFAAAPVLAEATGGTGACCFPGCYCYELTSQECAQGGGSYQGDGTSCIPNPCPCPQGACCLADGSCMILVKPQCDQKDGFWWGDATICDPNPCPQPGACCVPPDQQCEYVPAWACQRMGGVFNGDGVPCTDPSPCGQLPQACCFGCECVLLTIEDCTAQGGYAQPDYFSCEPNICECPSGACCLPDGSCLRGSYVLCREEGGEYQGDDTWCDPNPCPPVPTRPTSWGRIKSQYR